MELIDKSALVAEIEKLYKKNTDRCSIEGIAAAAQLRMVLDFLDTLEVKDSGTIWHSFDEVLPPQSSDICVYWDRDEIITTGIWEESEKPKYASKWAYTSDLLNK